MSAGAADPDMAVGQAESSGGVGNLRFEQFGGEFPVKLLQFRPDGRFVSGRNQERPVEGQHLPGEADRIQRPEVMEFAALAEFENGPARLDLLELSAETFDQVGIVRDDAFDFGGGGAQRREDLQPSVFGADGEGDPAAARRAGDDWRKFQFCSVVRPVKLIDNITVFPFLSTAEYASLLVFLPAAGAGFYDFFHVFSQKKKTSHLQMGRSGDIFKNTKRS